MKTVIVTMSFKPLPRRLEAWSRFGASFRASPRCYFIDATMHSYWTAKPEVYFLISHRPPDGDVTGATIAPEK